VFLYLLQLCDKLDIDLIDAAQLKLAANAQKYPVEKARGSSKKYTEL
jgi:dCTP diphosphatase